MEKDIDLSGVDPARWPEIRRRVAILDEYVAIWRPNDETRIAFADRLGVTKAHLMHLASIWRRERSPAAIPGARSRNAQKVVRRVSQRGVALVQETIASLGPMTRRKDIIAEATRRCALAGIDPPSNSTITNLLFEARAEADAAAELEPEILIDECVPKIPVMDGENLIFPRVLLAMALPQRRIVAFDASFETHRTPSLVDLMNRLDAVTTPGGVRLRLRAPRRSRAERVAIGALSRHSSVGKPTINRLLGRQLGDLDIVFRADRASDPATLLKGRLATPVSKIDAALAVEAAIVAHNARMHELPDTGFSIALHMLAAQSRFTANTDI